MKKCLHILPMNKLSGAEKLALILCENLKEYEPIVVCGGDSLKSIFESRGIRSYSIDFMSDGILKNSSRLAKIIKDEGISIVHAHDNNASINAYLTKVIQRLNVKVISHIHNCYPWLESKNKNKIIDSIFRKRYDHNIACGKLVYDFYNKHTNYINLNKTTILSNSIDIKNIKSNISTQSINTKEKFNIPKDKIIIGFVGRISEQKGIVPFIENFNNYKSKFEDCKFLIIGSGDQDELVKSMISKNKIEEYFIFTGHQENTYDFYDTIDIFFLPSLYEGLPMVILEAMTFEKPIVSMNVGSINEVIRENYNGHLVEAGDYEKFFKSLEELKLDKEKRKIFGANSLNIIKEKYDIEKYREKIEDLYDAI